MARRCVCSSNLVREEAKARTEGCKIHTPYELCSAKEGGEQHVSVCIAIIRYCYYNKTLRERLTATVRSTLNETLLLHLIFMYMFYNYHT